MHDNLEYSKTKAISNSSLHLLDKSPRQFLKFYNQEFEESDESFFIQGSAIHCYILEYKEFYSRYKLLDYTVPNSPNKKQFVENYLNSTEKTDKLKLISSYKKSYVGNLSDEVVLDKATELKKELKGYFKYLKLKEEGITILPGYFKSFLEILKKELQNNTNANKLLFTEENDFQDVHIYNELPIYWQYTIDNCTYDLKALLDRVLIDNTSKLIQLVDLKTTKSISEFSESFYNYRYDKQLAFYTLGIKAFFTQTFPKYNIEDYNIEHYIVAIDKNKDPESRVFKASHNTIFSALSEVKQLLDRAHWHFNNAKWEYTKEQYTEGYEIL